MKRWSRGPWVGVGNLLTKAEEGVEVRGGGGGNKE